MDSTQYVWATIAVDDIERAKTFYGQVLGFEQSDRDLGEDGSLFNGPGGATIFLYVSEAKRGETTALTIGVGDFDAAITHLQKNDVTFEVYKSMPGLVDDRGIYEYDDSKLVWFKDTEGNIINLFEDK